ncbi:GNAT family N-acetyltransferase [Lysobacter tyrosinilyticus]
MDFQRRAQGFRVRPLVAADASALHAAVRTSVDSLSYWLPWCHPDYSLADAEAWVTYAEAAWARQSEFPFGVFDEVSGELIGCTGLSQVNGLNRSANLGYWIGETHRGRGLATRAVALTAAIAFEELELVRLEIVVLPHNQSSLRVAEKLGATRETEARNRLMFQSRPSSAVVYSLIPGDLAADIVRD